MTCVASHSHPLHSCFRKSWLFNPRLPPTYRNNYCKSPEQGHMAAIMKRWFGELLVVPPVDPAKDSLLSPEDLKYKILIKAKKMKYVHILLVCVCIIYVLHGYIYIYAHWYIYVYITYMYILYSGAERSRLGSASWPRHIYINLLYRIHIYTPPPPNRDREVVGDESTLSIQDDDADMLEIKNEVRARMKVGLRTAARQLGDCACGYVCMYVIYKHINIYMCVCLYVYVYLYIVYYIFEMRVEEMCPNTAPLLSRHTHASLIPQPRFLHT